MAYDEMDADTELLVRCGAGFMIVADGFSCRTQIHELDSGGREGVQVGVPIEKGAIDSRPACDTRDADLVAGLDGGEP